jgi:hypothetical protein
MSDLPATASKLVVLLYRIQDRVAAEMARIARSLLSRAGTVRSGRAQREAPTVRLGDRGFPGGFEVPLRPRSRTIKR